MSSGAETIQVLHVDDDAELCELAKVQLQQSDQRFDVATETSAREGLATIESETVDCVVSDLDMPGMDGLEFLRAVRERDQDLPFILYTGKGSEEIASEAISAGVTDYLQKGTTSEQYDLLANRIERGVSEVRARAALEESERTFSTLVANLPGMVYRCRNERGWPMTLVSDGAAELTGHDPAAIESGDVDWSADVIHEADRDGVWNQVQVALEAGEPFEVTYRITTADGESRWVWERGRTVERDGDVDVLEGFITDITARRTREQELENEREFTEDVINALDDVFVVVDPDGSIVRWNDRATEVTGYDDATFAEMLVPEFFDDEAVGPIVEARETALAEGSATFEATVVTTDGQRLPYEFRLATVTSEDDRIRLCGIGRNVGDKRQREQELERYETVIQAVGDPMYTLDSDGVITFANDALARLTGYNTSTLVGAHIEMVLEGEDVEYAREEILSLLKAEDRRHAIFEMTVLTESGRQVPCENHIALLPMVDGEFRGTAGVIRDVSERKERERRLEEFASVVSHDLRNPLEVLAGRVELARETGDVSHLDQVDSPLDRMHQLIEDLLELAHSGQGTDELRPVDLASAAQNAWRSIDTDAATLTVAGSRTVEADPERLRALLENLFRNALEHGPGESLEARATGGVDGRIEVTIGETAAGFFVADDGVGIDDVDRTAMFQRGYTTQADGTGYGLAIVADVVDAHGWTIDAGESATGGARFDVEV